MSGPGRTLGFGERAKKAALVPHSRAVGVSLERVGLVALTLSIIASLAVFAKPLQWQPGWELNAVFENSINIRTGSPVRVSGVDVGEVKSLSRASNTNFSTVKMNIEEKGRPIMKDAQAKIRPRLFLEGSYFVDLKPGTPSAPELESGDTISVSQTATAVQFDEVLTALQADTRENLRETLKGLSQAFDGQGEPEEAAGPVSETTGESNSDETEDASSSSGEGTTASAAGEDAVKDKAGKRDLTGAEEINKTFDNLTPALKDTDRVSTAMLGEQAGDLRRLVYGLQRTISALDRNQPEIQDLVTNFNTTAAALASESASLSAAIDELPDTIIQARTTLGHLDSSLPALDAFAKDIRPGVREIPATVDASPGWLTQVGALVQEDELGGVLANLSPTVRDLAEVTADASTLLDEIDNLSRCTTDVMVPTFSQPVNDPPHTSGEEPYKEFFYALVGTTSALQNFDGNGPYISLAGGGGDTTVSLGKLSGVGETVFASVPSGNLPLGTRPKMPDKKPPYGPEKLCKDQKRPDLNAAETGPAPSVIATGSVTGAGGATVGAEGDNSGDEGVFGGLGGDPLGGEGE